MLAGGEAKGAAQARARGDQRRPAHTSATRRPRDRRPWIARSVSGKRTRVPARTGGARDDLREARTAALVAPRSAAGRLRRGARKARRRGPAAAVRRDRAGYRRVAWPGRLRTDRSGAARGRLDRADPCGAAEGRPRGRRQGAAAGRGRAGEARPRAASPHCRVSRGSLGNRAPSPARSARRRARVALAGRAQLRRGGEQRGPDRPPRRRLRRAPRRPAVIHPHVREDVLVQERVYGEKIERGVAVDPERAQDLARQLFSAYVRQIAAEGLYHADPHRGNILLTADGRLALLDFGLLGRLDDDTRRTIALLLLAIAQNRADDVAALILELSLTDFSTDEPGFMHELRRKLPRYHWRALSGIRAGEALADLQRIAVLHNVRLPTSFALVGKTLAQADSIARTLDPGLDPVDLLDEEGTELMLREAERRLEPNQLFAYLFTQVAPAARLPRRVSQVVERLETGTLKVGIAPTDLGGLERLLRSTANRLGAALIIAGLLVSSALMAQVNDAVSLVGYVLSGLIALYWFWKILRTPGDL